jgi:hypothetical protein
MAAPYSTIGSYTHGVWLISKGGQGAIVNASNLPKEGTGFRYYWLGATPSQALGSGGGRLFDAMRKLGLDVNLPNQNPGAAVNKAFASGQAALQEPTGPAGIKSGILAALGEALSNSGPAILAGIPGLGVAADAGLAGILGESATAGATAAESADAGLAGLLGEDTAGSTTPGESTKPGDSTKPSEETPGSKSGAGGAAAAAVKLAGGLAGLLGASAIEGFIVRALEALVAIALIALGLQALTGTGTGNPVSAARTVAGGAAKVIR